MSKKDKETRGPFTILVCHLEGDYQVLGEVEIYTTGGVLDFSLSAEGLEATPWKWIEESISSKIKTLGSQITELSKQRTQLGEVLRAGDPRKVIAPKLGPCSTCKLFTPVDPYVGVCQHPKAKAEMKTFDNLTCTQPMDECLCGKEEEEKTSED